MAFSYNEVGPVNAGFTTVSLTFPFLDRAHVSVSVDKIVLGPGTWVWNSDTQIELNDPLVGGEVVKVFRTTPAAGVQADFKPGAFDYEELNTSLLHLLYIVQEAYDNSSVAVEAGNNAFSYLIQIEDLVDDAVVMYADMQALYAQYGTQATNATNDLAARLATALSDITTASNAALAAITSQQTTSVNAVSAQQTTSVNAVVAARTSAETSINALVAQATAARDAAEGHKNTASTKAAEAAASAASINPATLVKNTAQTLTSGEKLQARTNIGADDATSLTTGTLPSARLPSDAYKRSNILDALGHLAGQPTGGILQRGSNANGAWVMFANGTLICSREGVTLSKSSGTTWVSTSLSWPVAFVGSNPHCIASVGVPTSNQIITVAVTADLSTYSLYINSTDALSNQPLHVFAIGRWF